MPGARTPGDAVPYDFRRPNKFTRDHVRALQIANETFARQFTTVLSSTLRAVCQVQLRAVGQLGYDELIRELPNPSYLAVLRLAPLSGASLLHIPLPLVMAIVDRILGGNGSGTLPERPITDIEGSLMAGLLSRVLGEMHYAWQGLVALEPEVASQESNPQFAQVAAASDMVVTITFDLRVGDRTGEAVLCVPFSSLQPVLDGITGRSMLLGPVVEDAAALEAAVGERVRDAGVGVAVSFGEVRLSSAEILDLRVGDVVPLAAGPATPLTVLVEGVPCFAAMPGRRGKRLACLIVDPEPEGA
jgi:flagellar motor switch protein FliM